MSGYSEWLTKNEIALKEMEEMEEMENPGGGIRKIKM